MKPYQPCEWKTENERLVLYQALQQLLPLDSTQLWMVVVWYIYTFSRGSFFFAGLYVKCTISIYYDDDDAIDALFSELHCYSNCKMVMAKSSLRESQSTSIVRTLQLFILQKTHTHIHTCTHSPKLVNNGNNE